MNASSREIKNDYNSDFLLIFKELEAMDGKVPPTTKKDLCQFFHESKMEAFHQMLPYHRSAPICFVQVYLAWDLHNTVHHGGLLWPAPVNPLHKSITSPGICHVYYSTSVHIHSNQSLHILNGKAGSHQFEIIPLFWFRYTTHVQGEPKCGGPALELTKHSGALHPWIYSWWPCQSFNPLKTANWWMVFFPSLSFRTSCLRLTKITNSTVVLWSRTNNNVVMQGVSWTRTASSQKRLEPKLYVVSFKHL